MGEVEKEHRFPTIEFSCMKYPNPLCRESISDLCRDSRQCRVIPEDSEIHHRVDGGKYSL